jgi:tetratricopeptide (TPR) repeat protein
MPQAREHRTISWLQRFGVQAAALALLVLLAYGASLDNGFHFDDYAALSDPYVAGEGFGWEILRPQQTRPLTYLTFHWNHLLGGTRPQGYHAVNLSLHIANAALLLWIARRRLPVWAAGFAALLFALHPLQTEAVTYIFARSSLLATFFALWTVVFYLRGRLVWSAILFALSLLAKEETVALPAALLLLDYLDRRRPSPGYYAALFGLAALAAARMFWVLSTLPDPGVGFRIKGVSTLAYALTQARVVWIYLRLFVAPVGLNLDHDVPLSTGLVSPWTTAVAVAALAATLAALAYLGWQRRNAAVWALGFFVLLSPSSSVVAQADVIFEHRTYFPLFCLVVAVGAVARYLSPRLSSGVLSAAAAVLALAMILGTAIRNQAWFDEKTLWTDAQQKSPNKARVYLGLARAFPDDSGKARELLERGLALDPQHVELLTNLGVVLLAQNDGPRALELFERAMRLSRETPELWNNIGASRFRMGQLEEAIGAYRRALALESCHYNSRRNLMYALSELGRKEEAFRAGELPPGCRLPAEKAKELAQYRERFR